MRYFILGQEVDEKAYAEYMVEFESLCDYVQRFLDGELTIDDVPDKFKEEVQNCENDPMLIIDILTGDAE